MLSYQNRNAKISGKQKAAVRSSLFWGAPKSLEVVTEAMKLKDTCSLGEKL